MIHDSPTLYSYEKFRPLKQLYVGQIVDNEDPKGLGRVKVEIPGLTLGIKKDYLPWYQIMLPTFLGGSMYTQQFAVPQVNTQVYVMFPTEDIYVGLVIGSVLNRKTMPYDQLNLSVDYLIPKASERHFTKGDEIDNESKNQKHFDCGFDQDYPGTWGWVSNAMTWMRENMFKKTFEFVHNSFTKLKIFPNGDTVIHIAGNLKLIIDGDFYTEVRGNEDHIVFNSKYEHIIGNHVEMVEHMKMFEAKRGYQEKAQRIVMN